MICRSELKRLQARRDYPSLSLLAPTHRTHPANRQDRIVVKNLAAEALDRLHGEFKKREVTGVVQNLNRLVDRMDWKHMLEGLAVFASRDVAMTVQLPFRPRARVVIDETFATRDLVYSLNRSPRYRVLVLTEKPTRLFDAITNVLTEYVARPFPMVHTGPGGKSRLPGGQGINRSAVRDDALRQFFRSADEAVDAVQKPNPLPLVGVGVERNLAFYQEVTRQAGSIVGMLAGNHERTSPSALGK